ncbi:MAG: NAD(P)/FAD-dependent oxidoreductase, partial [Chloroflexota bacterium]|nr:NAD(P)/FAD-dependent oxidoreductase [Chloroflexota bacterium]
HMPRAVVFELQTLWFPDLANVPITQIRDKDLVRIGNILNAWLLKPAGTEGYRTAEVTVGGVNTNAISSQTMEVKNYPGLYFVGEVLDVTGQLGGFNFQWAWASGYVAGLVA